ncbi:MAG: diguanylate cyclase [Desulfosudaceae bacterium]
MYKKHLPAEKRAHPRIIVPDGTVVMELGNSLKMGRLIDISLGGAGICYPEQTGHNLNGQKARLHILIQQPFFCLENIPFQVVFDAISNTAVAGPDFPRRCGLRFEELSSRQKKQLMTMLSRQQPLNDPPPSGLAQRPEKSEEDYRLILEGIREGYFEVDIAGNIKFFNNALLDIIGYSREELMGLNYKAFMSRDTARRVFQEYNRAYLTDKLPTPFDWELVKKEGAIIHVETSLSFIKDAAGNITGFRGIARDVSSRKRFERELLYLATHDQLTGLFNRGALFEKLRETIAYARRFQKRCALLFLDLDNFKAVNDRFGHETGDRVLKEVAARLSGLLRETDYVCRHGGDEFTIILNNADRIDPVLVASKIGETIREPYQVSKHRIDFISTSIGISLYPDDGADIDSLVSYADKAMYKAKKKKNRSICYNHGKFTRRL